MHVLCLSIRPSICSVVDPIQFLFFSPLVTRVSMLDLTNYIVSHLDIQFFGPSIGKSVRSPIGKAICPFHWKNCRSIHLLAKLYVHLIGKSKSPSIHWQKSMSICQCVHLSILHSFMRRIVCMNCPSFGTKVCQIVTNDTKIKVCLFRYGQRLFMTVNVCL